MLEFKVFAQALNNFLGHKMGHESACWMPNYFVFTFQHPQDFHSAEGVQESQSVSFHFSLRQIFLLLDGNII